MQLSGKGAVQNHFITMAYRPWLGVPFFPPRWHNTVIQILASCGIVGFAAYSFHRLQTLYLFFHRFQGKKTFALISMLTLLVTSMVDCHFFNVGPVLIYSAILAFVEFQLNKTKSES